MKGLKNVLQKSLLLTMACCLIGGAAYAGSDTFFEGVISLTPGDSDSKTFLVQGPIQLPAFKPFKGFLIITTGEGGALTVSLKADIEKTRYDGELRFGLVGFGSSAEPVFFEIDETPATITVNLPIEGAFGLAVAGAFIVQYDNIDLPVEFTMTAAFSEPEAEE